MLLLQKADIHLEIKSQTVQRNDSFKVRRLSNFLLRVLTSQLAGMGSTSLNTRLSPWRMVVGGPRGRHEDPADPAWVHFWEKYFLCP